jgi:transcription antitermination factor NusG
MPVDQTAPLDDGPKGQPSWFAVHTQHQHEKAAANSLTCKGFEVFLPLYSTVRRWSDRNKEISLPLFSSYLFLRGGLDRQLSILTTPGVFGVVSFAGVPAVIPDAEIDAVRQAITTGAHVNPHPFLKTGDWVRITQGPLEGLEGILLRTKGQFRLVLSVEIIQKSVVMEVDAWAVERAKPVSHRSTPMNADQVFS